VTVPDVPRLSISGIFRWRPDVRLAQLDSTLPASCAEARNTQLERRRSA
jgi:hypothetical protein